MSRKTILTGLFFMSISMILSAQGTDTDSLMSLIKNAGEDTVLVNNLISLSGNLYRQSPSEAIQYGIQAREIAERLKYHTGIAYALKNIGMAYFCQGEYPKAIDSWQQARDIFESENHKLGVANMLSNLGAVYNNVGDDAKALDLYLRSLKISEETGDSLRILTAMINIGLVYLKKPVTYDKALEYYLMALPLSEALNDMDALGTTTVNLGELYYMKGDYATALSYFDRSLAAFHQSSSGNVSYAMTSIGKVFAKLGDFPEAIDYQQRALEIASDLESKPDMVLALVGMAETYREKGDIQSSLEYFNQAKEIAKEIGAIYELRDVYNGLANSYAEISDFKNAFYNLDQLLKINDTIFSELSQQQINKLRIQYESEAIERENKLLKRDMELSEARDRNQMLVIYLFILGFIFTLISIGLLHRSNNLKRKANIDLKKKDEIKSEYVMRITHDIKGHLAAIKSSLDVLHSKSLGGIRQDCMEFLDMASQRTTVLIRFVKDLLSMSKLQLSNEIKSNPFSIRESVDKTVSHLEHQAGEKSIRINVNIDDSVDKIQGVQISIEELLTNLVSNAIQYSDHAGDVNLQIKSLNGKVQFEVQDQGKGIPEQEQEMIFEEFYRGSKTRKTTEGTGLGLAISKKIVQAHGGKIWVESSEDKGSKFCFTLPLEHPAVN